MAEIEEFLKKKELEGALRVLRPIASRKEGEIKINGKRYLDFSSNDYLGLAQHPKMIEAAKDALSKFGTASCGSRLLSGDLELHHLLEEKVARFKNKESALVFNSGYQANIGIISSLCGKESCIFSDKLNHASIVDGILLSGARFFRFQHNDVEHLESLLKKERARFKNAMIITESVFSMDGDIAPLKDLVCLKEKYNCTIMVDEAHATGIFGETGSGIVEQEGLSEKVDLIMGTFSKALGSFGAYLAAPKKLIEYLVNTCRSFIYSTALPPSVIACNLKSLELIKEEPGRRKKLLAGAEYFRNTLKANDLAVRGSSQIVPLVLGDNLKVVEFAKNLQEKGYWVLPIRPPTVPDGQARLRFSLTFYHNTGILKQLVEDIRGNRV